VKVRPLRKGGCRFRERICLRQRFSAIEVLAQGQGVGGFQLTGVMHAAG
jgi:hypothetical protein